MADLGDSTNAALEKNGLPPRSQEEIRSFIGHGVLNLVERAAAACGEQGNTEKIYRDFLEHYGHNYMNKTCPYPGTMKMIETLKDCALKLAVVSNKYDGAVKELSEKFFGKYMDFALGETKELKKKPAPDMIYAALKNLGVSPEDALYVGDSEVDAQTAENAGMDYVLVTWGFGRTETIRKFSPSAFVDTNEELLKYIKAHIGIITTAITEK